MAQDVVEIVLALDIEKGEVETVLQANGLEIDLFRRIQLLGHARQGFSIA